MKLASTTPPLTSAIRFASGVPVITVKTHPLAVLKTNGSHKIRQKGMQLTGKTRSALQDVVTREYTIHLHKHVHGRSFKKRAPWAVKSVVTFAQKSMGVKDELWKQGVKNVPHRVRVKLERKRNDDEDAKEKLYVYASHVPVPSFKGLQTLVVEAE
ncbi:ribosomal protein L31e [Rhizoctonia solani]|uniref:Ribosomal protein L31e n=1 Tax=Rhizoctonia solani TaxID=456999 RepID=A0A8H8P5U9_9AGAM|nr:ribosomal protein L31e [Rhizoctonia solani]QRW26059.1 ribosomal protein L31e [Rhizoctonia solani]